MKRAYALAGEADSKWGFAIYAEFEDGFYSYFYEDSEEICMAEIAYEVEHHGECTYYTGINNEDRTDGEWVGRENYIYG